MSLAANGVVSLPVRAYRARPVLTVARALVATEVSPFRLIGVRAPGSVEQLELRVSTDGVWGEWEGLERSAGPDDVAGEARAASTGEVSEPRWVGEADGWQLRGTGSAAAEVLLIREEGERITLPPRTAASAAARAATRRLCTRGANGERASAVNPSYASTVKMAFVHHTVDSNAYGADDVPAMLRAIQAITSMRTAGMTSRTTPSSTD